MAYKNAVFTQTSRSTDGEPNAFPQEFHIKLEKKKNLLDIEYSLKEYEEISLSFQILMKRQLILHSLETFNYKITQDALKYDLLDLLNSHDEIVPILKLDPIDETNIINDNQQNNTGSVTSQTAGIIPSQTGATDIVSVTHLLNDMSRQLQSFKSRVELKKSTYRGHLTFENQSSAENQQILRTIIQFIQNCKSFFIRVFPDFPIADLDGYESALCAVMNYFPGDCDFLALIDRSIGVIVGIIQEIQVNYNLHQLTYVDEKPQPGTEIRDPKIEYSSQKHDNLNTKINYSKELLKSKGQDWLRFYVDMTTNPTYSGDKKILTALVDTGSRYTLIPAQWTQFSYFEDGNKITQKFTGVGGETAKVYDNFVTVDVKLEYFQETTIRFENAVLILDQRRKYIIVGRKDLQKFGFFCDFGFDIFGFKALGNHGITATFPIHRQLNYCDKAQRKRRKSI